MYLKKLSFAYNSNQRKYATNSTNSFAILNYYNFVFTYIPYLLYKFFFNSAINRFLSSDSTIVHQ